MGTIVGSFLSGLFPPLWDGSHTGMSPGGGQTSPETAANPTVPEFLLFPPPSRSSDCAQEHVTVGLV